MPGCRQVRQSVNNLAKTSLAMSPKAVQMLFRCIDHASVFKARRLAYAASFCSAALHQGRRGHMQRRPSADGSRHMNTDRVLCEVIRLPATLQASSCRAPQTQLPPARPRRRRSSTAAAGRSPRPVRRPCTRPGPRAHSPGTRRWRSVLHASSPSASRCACSRQRLAVLLSLLTRERSLLLCGACSTSCNGLHACLCLHLGPPCQGIF